MHPAIIILIAVAVFILYVWSSARRFRRSLPVPVAPPPKERVRSEKFIWPSGWASLNQAEREIVEMERLEQRKGYLTRPEQEAIGLLIDLTGWERRWEELKDSDHTITRPVDVRIIRGENIVEMSFEEFLERVGLIHGRWEKK